MVFGTNSLLLNHSHFLLLVLSLYTNVYQAELFSEIQISSQELAQNPAGPAESWELSNFKGLEKLYLRQVLRWNYGFMF